MHRAHAFFPLFLCVFVGARAPGALPRLQQREHRACTTPPFFASPPGTCAPPPPLPPCLFAPMIRAPCAQHTHNPTHNTHALSFLLRPLYVARTGSNAVFWGARTHFFFGRWSDSIKNARESARRREHRKSGENDPTLLNNNYTSHSLGPAVLLAQLAVRPAARERRRGRQRLVVPPALEQLLAVVC